MYENVKENEVLKFLFPCGRNENKEKQKIDFRFVPLIDFELFSFRSQKKVQLCVHRSVHSNREICVKKNSSPSN